MEDLCQSYCSISEVFEAQDDVDNTPLSSNVEGHISMQSSASGISCTVTRALTPFTKSPPSNRRLDDGNTSEQAL
jgi:hypothetical protein